MDELSTAYLDRRFAEMQQRFDAKIDDLRAEMEERFTAVDQRFAASEERFAAIDQRFEAIDQRFEAIDRRLIAIDRRFAAIDRRFDKVEAQIRHTHVVLEDLRSSVQLIAENMSAMNQKLDRYIEAAEKKREVDRSETRAGFRAVHERCDDLDRRVSRLETN